MSLRFLVANSKPYHPIFLALGLSWAAFSAGCGSDTSSGGGASGTSGSSGHAGTSSGTSEGGEGGASAGASDTAGAAGSAETAGAAGAAGASAIDTTTTPPPYLASLAESSFLVGMDFGSPYDSILGQPITSLKSAILPGFKTAPVAGQLVGDTTIQFIETTEDLYSALNISASMDISYGAFGASAKIDFAKSQQLSSKSIYLFVDATASGLTNKIVEPALTAAAQKLGPDAFYRAYGDRYVSEIVTGVELVGVLEIQTKNEEDKESIAASLKVSYLASSLSASFSSTLNTAVGSDTITMHTRPIGFTPAATVDLNNPTQFLTTAANFSSVIGTTADTNAQALTLVYTNYYGLPGYPGVPAGTAANVVKEAQAVSDYVLYDSVLQNEFSPYIADSTYASLPFFSGMVKYRDALSKFITNSFTDSQDLPDLPQIDDASRFETFVTTSHTVASTPNFVVNTLANGVVPKRISDYEIPLHYAHNGVLHGVKFSPVASIAPAVDVTQKNPVVYPLYFVDKTAPPGAQRRVLSYKWDTGTYFLDNATVGGQPDDVKIAQQLYSLVINDYAGPEAATFNTFVLVNKASGEVLTNTGASSGHLTQGHFGLDNKFQEWQFRLASCSPGTTYSPGQALYFRALSSAPNTNLWLDLANNDPTTGNYYQLYNYDNACTAAETFYMTPGFDSDMQSIYGYGGAANGYMAADTTISAPADGAAIVVQPKSGNDNQLWRFIPTELIDRNP